MRTIDVVVGQGTSIQQMYHTICPLPFEAETSVTQVRVIHVRSEVVVERQLAKRSKLQCKSKSAMHENVGNGEKKNSNRWSGLMSRNLKYLAVVEGSLLLMGWRSVQ